MTLKARDGLTLPSYLTLPPTHNSPNTLLPQNPDHPDQASSPDDPESTSQPSAWRSLRGLQLPLVLFVHGGPWGRDVWGLDTTAQWFANRGYAVLQVSTYGNYYLAETSAAAELDLQFTAAPGSCNFLGGIPGFSVGTNCAV